MSIQANGASGPIGVIMLDTRFPRFNGDIGNSDTWPFDVIFFRVHGASARAVVCQTSSQSLQPFIDAGRDLQERGAIGITTSCGFLSLVHAELSSYFKVPFVASSLTQVPWVQSLLPSGRQVGVMTIDSDALSFAHLHSLGIDESVPIMGTQTGKEFTHCIMNDLPDMSWARCRDDNVNAAIAFKKRHPELGAIVLECTNMAPYASAIQAAVGMPVYSIYTLISWLHSGLQAKAFIQPD